jgi:hypothetical protein
MYAQNDVYISMIGPSIPVLLTSGEEDTTDPPSSADADYAYYQAHCGCDASQLLLPDTAHLFMVHRSLPSWVDYVVNWLIAHGLAATPSASSFVPYLSHVERLFGRTTRRLPDACLRSGLDDGCRVCADCCIRELPAR